MGRTLVNTQAGNTKPGYLGRLLSGLFPFISQVRVRGSQHLQGSKFPNLFKQILIIPIVSPNKHE